MQLLPFVIVSHQYSLPKYLLKLNYSALKHVTSSNKQTHSTGDVCLDFTSRQHINGHIVPNAKIGLNYYVKQMAMLTWLLLHCQLLYDIPVAGFI
jgi:hypothetical protein